MSKIKNREIADNGSVLLDDYSAVEALYKDVTSGKDILEIIVKQSDEVSRFNIWADLYGMPKIKSTIEIDHRLRQQDIFLPDEYKNFNIQEFLLAKCRYQNEIDRVVEEYKLFEDEHLIDLLRYLKYIVDLMRKEDIVWGVGRGSSVSSYILFLIGIHKIDSLKYELPIEEFFK